MGLERLDIHMQTKKKMNFTFTKINSKWLIDLKVKCKTIKILVENIKENLIDLWYNHNFVAIPPKI